MKNEDEKEELTTTTYGNVSEWTSMVECLAANRIIAFEWLPASVRLREGCDDFFTAELTYPQMRQLLAELTAQCAEHEPKE